MFVKSTFVFATLVALAQARFGEENKCQGVIGALGGGEAATLGGQSISTLLAGSNACDKLALADKVAALDLPGALEAAKCLVQAEKNFNPFVNDRPNICSDAGLPATAGLRGILPLIDPAVDGAAAVNAASAASLNAPLNQGGSQADLLTDFGFTTFNAQAVGGAAAAPPPANNNNAGNNNNNNNNAGNDNNVNNGGNDNNNNGGNDNNDIVEVVEPPAAAPPAAAGTDIQSFDGDLGSPIEAISFSGNANRPFDVAGDTFVNFAAAATRSCDRQFNRCANAANGGADFSVGDCTAQKTACQAAQNSAAVKSFDTGAAAAPVAATPVANNNNNSGACKRHLSKRDLAVKAKRENLLKTILSKRAELASLEQKLVEL